MSAKGMGAKGREHGLDGGVVNATASAGGAHQSTELGGDGAEQSSEQRAKRDRTANTEIWLPGC